MESLEYLRKLAIFAKSIDHGSFRGAARALRLSPSVVSHHVTQLEKQLGTSLVHRSTRKLSLTPDGERLLGSARAMLNAAEAGLQAVSDQTLQPSGLLRITAPAVLAQSRLITYLSGYVNAFPKVRLLLDFSDARRDLIGDGFDVAIRMGQLRESSFRTKELFHVSRRLVAAARYIADKPEPQSPKDLTDWDWLELTPVAVSPLQFSHGVKRVTVRRPAPRISANDAQALCALARAGAGLAVVPQFVAEPDINSGELEYVLPKWELKRVRIFAAWPASAPRNSLIEHFVLHLLSEARS